MTLAQRIRKRIGDIPASNPGYISARQETLDDLLARDLLDKIAKVAAEEATKHEST